MIYKCKTCGKKVFFWNFFKRKYGKGIEINLTTKRIRPIMFCSEDCMWKYKSRNSRSLK